MRYHSIVRRARLSFQADLYKNWRLRIQYNLLNSKKPYRSLFLRYRGFYNTYITVGQFGNPFSLEKYTSSNGLTFMERSLANGLSPSANLGIGLQRWGNNWSIASGVFWKSDIRDEMPFSEKKGREINARFTIAPMIEKYNIMHFGTSFAYGLPDRNKKIRIDSRPESALTNVRFISTEKMKNINKYFYVGLEASVLLGRLTVQAEYTKAWFFRDREKEKNESFDGGYISLSLLLNPYQRRYSNSSGTFGQIKPKKNIIWEVAVRQSFLNLNSRTVIGGRQDNTTWALNSYLNSNTRLMFNYIQISTDHETNQYSEIFQMRLQWLI